MPSLIVKSEVLSPTLIVLISLILVIFFWCFIAYKMAKSPPANQLLLACRPGECGVNFLNGEKQCPRETDGVILIDASYQVCGGRSVCTSSLAPYALLPNGSTNNLGICAGGSTCRCLKTARCATHVASLFNVVNGSIYSPSAGDRHVFQQILTTDGTSGVSFSSPSTNFCAIKTSSLNRLAPGACSFSDSDYLNPKSTILVATDCVNSNPCVRGVMAFDPNNPEILETSGVDIEEVINIPVTCVNATISCDTDGTPCPGNVCPVAQVPYFDSRWNLVRCADINYPRV